MTEPEIKEAKRTGEQFAVARAAVRKAVYDRRLGAEVTETTYMGLTALGAVVEELMPLGVGQRVRASGELRRDTFTRRDGNQGSDLKLEVKRLELLEDEPESLDDASWADAVVAAGPGR